MRRNHDAETASFQDGEIPHNSPNAAIISGGVNHSTLLPGLFTWRNRMKFHSLYQSPLVPTHQRLGRIPRMQALLLRSARQDGH
jgi:hypothetical protein